jgi:ferritin-like metal-binding protein YciE
MHDTILAGGPYGRRNNDPRWDRRLRRHTGKQEDEKWSSTLRDRVDYDTEHLQESGGPKHRGLQRSSFAAGKMQNVFWDNRVFCEAQQRYILGWRSGVNVNLQTRILIMIKAKSANHRRQVRTGDDGDNQGSERMENPLHDAFLDEVADIYNAEQQLIKALPRMAKAAQSEELKEALESHLQETEEQARRIEEAMETMGETLRRKKCKGMEGLLAEGKEMIEEFEDNQALDAVLIAAAQKIEHYEIASYGTICAWAEQMNHSEALNLFRECLEEEKGADEKLTHIAENAANIQADEKE